MASFKIGINMAGAVSAGAYTAGVLDFLTEALDEWYKAKARNEAVPGHDVSIEVFTGASAGGMCSAISAVQLQHEFDHIHDTAQVDGSGKKVVTTNHLYESWVNQIDILPLLDTSDLKKGKPVVSLLNSTVIAEIAEYALTPPSPLPAPRPWVAPDLTLFLSLTNLRGTPYSLNAAAPGSLEETTFFYGSRIAFRTSRSGAAAGPFTGSIRTIDLTRPDAAGGWDVLQTAAMATGAFPVFLAPRILKRYISEFVPPHWMGVNIDASGPPIPVPPSFPAYFPEPFDTLNVDGGITNNDPFNFAHDYLANLAPATGGQNPRSPLEADRAVINVAPFPTVDKFDPAFDAAANSSVLSAFGKLFSALISQARFYGESLGDIMCGTTFSRFIIAPSDAELTRQHIASGGTPATQPPALQCASLGAFGGFLDRKFRAHDYALGRRNCQKFLLDSFVLPVANPIIATGLDKLDPQVKQQVIDSYKRDAPGDYSLSAEQMAKLNIPLPAGQAQAGGVWLPIIPLCTTYLQTELPPVKREQMSRQRLDLVVKLMLKRYRVVVSRLIDLVPSAIFRLFLRSGQPFIAWRLKGPLRNALIANLGDGLEPK